MKHRLISLISALISLAVVGGGFWHFSLQNLYDLQVERAEIDLPQWDNTLPPLRLAMLADLHLGFWEEDWLRRIVQLTLEEKADICLLMGDYRYAINHETSMSPEKIAELLRPLQSCSAVFYVTGNHDTPAYAERDRSWGRRMKAELDKLGFINLENKRFRYVRQDGQQMDLQGLPYYRNFTKDRTALLFQEPREEGVPLVAVVHDSGDFLRYPIQVDLCLGSHSHGGQICLPGGMPLLPSGERPPEEQRGGFHRNACGSPHYISRGLGVSTLPLRINCPPEISILDLK